MLKTDFSIYGYLTIGESDKPWGLYVTSGGSCDIPAHVAYPPDRHPNTYSFDWKKGRILPEFAIVYISKGEGFFESKTIGRKRIGEGTALILFPGEWHTYAPDPATGWKEYWVCFDGTQPNTLLENKIISPEEPIVDIGYNAVFIQLYNQILELLEEESIGYKARIASITYQIIAQLYTAKLGKKFSGKRIETVVQKAKINMAENLNGSVDFKQLASDLNVGYSWFRRMFRHHTGLAPRQYYLQLKINKAKVLLRETSLNVKEVSSRCGFESQYYFSKYFKKSVGFSPIKWRQFSRGG